MVLKIESLRNKIQQQVINSQLNIGVIYLLFEKMTKELEVLYKQQIEKEAMEEWQKKIQQEQKEKSQESQD